MSVFQEQREISMDCINDSLASGVISKRRRVEDRAVTPVVLGGNIYKLVVVSFGLLCILQAVLNVSLRYALNASDKKTSGTDTCSKNQTEELDRLRRKLINSDASDKKTSGPDTCSKNQTEELDRLRRKLINAAGTATELDHLKSKSKILKVFFPTMPENDFQQGWVYFHRSLYYISSMQKSWQDSRDDCLQKGADLVIINSKEEHDFTRKFHEMMWIGLTDFETKGTWKWVDGSPLNQSYWASGEPNNYRGKGENCVQIKLYNEENSWNDKICENLNFWICEKMLALSQHVKTLNS
ncbi:hypothetical protein INR49_015440 [Caranx melampygus]|nr:hypothetical protein INR49_015440 [Caranx melampygus]